MFIINDNQIIIKENIVSIDPLMGVHGVKLYKDVDISNPLVDPEPNYIKVGITTYIVGATLKMSNGDEHKIYRLHKIEDREDDGFSEERLTNESHEYALQIAGLIFPSKKVQHLKIGR